MELQLEREGGGLDRPMLTNSLFCVMKSLKCYVNSTAELFTFYQQGKFPLTRAASSPTPLFSSLGTFFSQTLFSLTARSRRQELGLPGLPTPPAVTH